MKAFLLLAWLAAALPAPPPGLIKVEPPKPAPPLALADLDGNRVDLRALHGRWVLLHFWAGWCAPCREELPALQRLAGQLPRDRLTLVLVNTAESEEQVFAFLPTVAPDLNTYLDPDGSVTERWQPRGLPSSFLVGPEGDIRYLALGGRQWDSPAYLAFLRALPVEE